jgi:hypothetical protein
VALEVVSSVMKKIVFAVASVALAVSLAGCASGPKNYSTVDDLKKAYVQAGGDCAKGTVVDTSAIVAASQDLVGLAGVSCTNDIGLFVFPSTKARDYFIDLVDGAATASKTGVHMVVGEKWMVGGVTLDNKKFAASLGGTARY